MATILIIEDSSYMRRLIRKILDADHYEIIEADNGLKGLQMAAQKTPDCILLDLVMPEVDGLKILRLFQEQKKGIPVIVVTADIQETVRQQCLDLGAIAFINKPPRERELRETIRKVLPSGKEENR